MSFKGSYAGVGTVSFRDMLLKEPILRAIGEAGFEHPSEVQQNAIPFAMVGQDMIVQAKSGMGKTAVFVIATLQQIEPDTDDPSIDTLVLCHTREMAYQVHREFERLGKYIPDVKNGVVYGGVNVNEQKKVLKESMPHILIGTPGRVLQFVKDRVINLDQLKRLILDECDEMLRTKAMRIQVQEIFKKTPSEKQVMMCSATIGASARSMCRQISRNAEEIFIDDKKLTLHGLQQHYVEIDEKEKIKKLNDLLDSLDFNQVMVFVKSKERAAALDKVLQQAFFPSIAIHSGLKQEERLERYRKFKDFESRVLVSTNLCGRGVDMERVNIVINFDVPKYPDSYLHRVGRAGRFGTKGLAVTFISGDEDKQRLKAIQERFEVKVTPLPKNIKASSYKN